jgi:hypothetical protein
MIAPPCKLCRVSFVKPTYPVGDVMGFVPQPILRRSTQFKIRSIPQFVVVPWHAGACRLRLDEDRWKEKNEKKTGSKTPVLEPACPKTLFAQSSLWPVIQSNH